MIIIIIRNLGLEFSIISYVTVTTIIYYDKV